MGLADVLCVHLFRCVILFFYNLYVYAEGCEGCYSFYGAMCFIQGSCGGAVNVTCSLNFHHLFVFANESVPVFGVVELNRPITWRENSFDFPALVGY